MDNIESLLITGGTGSFGKTLTRYLLKHTQIPRIVILSRDEFKQWEMQQSPDFNSPRLRFFLGDVRDVSRLERAFQRVDVVIHAAALKQVPAAEYNPTEFIKTNVLGAMNVADAAIANGVQKVLTLSTDKAVNPVNLYGATKLCQDKLMLAANSYVGKAERPLFSVVRYGNVTDSRGSIIPFWKEKIAQKKPLPITSTDMTRFLISLEDSVRFVLACLAKMEGGEIFVPKLPSFKITDLAEALAPQYPTEIIGIRPGEKIHEVLISDEEARHTLDENNHYTVYPEHLYRATIPTFSEAAKSGIGHAVPPGFVYSSGNNSDFLSVEAIRKRL